MYWQRFEHSSRLPVCEAYSSCVTALLIVADRACCQHGTLLALAATEQQQSTFVVTSNAVRPAVTVVFRGY